MILIAAMTADRVLGANGSMPWDVPEEYERYRETVRGATVVFGRKSYEVFGPDLADSRLIVVTRGGPIGGVETADSLSAALRLADEGSGPVFVAGGASIYGQALPLADRMYLSTIHGDYEGDVYFPAFDEAQWRLVRHEEHTRYDFREWARRSDATPAADTDA